MAVLGAPVFPHGNLAFFVAIFSEMTRLSAGVGLRLHSIHSSIARESKWRYIMQLDESLTLNERLNSENRAGNIQALKNDLRKTKELLQSEKKKTHTAQAMIEECRDKQRQAEQERDYALSHQKKVEIPVEKPVLYQKCGNCNLTAYLKAKEKYDTQREKLAGRYKTKTAMYEA